MDTILIADARQRALATLAAAKAEELTAAMALLADGPAVVDLKPVETGLVMLRGRTGGDGAPFNVGEATVTRAVVRAVTGEVGHGYRLGRDKQATRHAAIIDAAWQSEARRALIEARILEPIRVRIAAERERASAEAAASRVEFFTLARENT
ncbi:MAG: phosphonate C-P lyase system protein PhnG [Hyphomicrobiaceae bacterium]